MSSAAMTETEMTGGKVQRRAGKNEPRPGTSIPWPQNRLDIVSFVHGFLSRYQSCVWGSIGRVITAGHPNLNVTKATFVKVSFQSGQCVFGIHIGNQSQIEFRNGLVWENGFATHTGITTNEAFYIYRGVGDEPLQ